MKQLWKMYIDRVDAASLRERVMIFAAAAVAMVALLNALLIEPEFVKQRRLSREVAQRQSEIKVLQEQLEKLARVREADPDQPDRLRLEQMRKRIAELETKLAQEQRKFAPPEQIGAILEEMLSRNRKLALVDMRTLPAAALGAGGEKPAADKPAADKPAADKPAAEKPAAAPSPAKPAVPGQIYRHGVELSVSGAYLDLLAYLKDLEKLPSQMYWGKLELNAGPHPKVTLKLSVYTLSLDPAWLRV